MVLIGWEGYTAGAMELARAMELAHPIELARPLWNAILKFENEFL
jgi:hypothetical protein